MKLKELDQKILSATSLFGMNLNSRIHELNGFDGKLFLKRDDELSFGISGNKMRKIASLYPFWKQSEGPVIAVGSATSNHIVACLQVFNERSIPFQLWLKESHHKLGRGNQAYISLLCGNNSIRWISKSDWPHVDEIGDQYLSQLGGGYYMKEGACQEDALWGAMSLGQDIIQGDTEFQHIFVDAGTGLSAVALRLYLDAAKWDGSLHIVCMAPLSFQELDQQFRACTGIEEYCQVFVHKPATGKSYGSFNRRCADEVVRFAREEGVILDPLYGAKLGLTVRDLLQEHLSTGEKGLMIHSGGALSLGGFWDRLGGSL